MIRTGIFATEKEIESMKRCIKTPLIMLQCGMPESPQKMAHRLALSHHLLEIEGYYGCDLKTGEFVKV